MEKKKQQQKQIKRKQATCTAERKLVCVRESETARRECTSALPSLFFAQFALNLIKSIVVAVIVALLFYLIVCASNARPLLLL